MSNEIDRMSKVQLEKRLTTLKDIISIVNNKDDVIKQIKDVVRLIEAKK